MSGAKISQDGGVPEVPESDLTHPHQTDKQAKGRIQLSVIAKNHNK